MDKINRWVENEDWAEVITDRQLAYVGDGKYEAIVNFGGPMARTAYYFYARVREASASVISCVELEGEEFHGSYTDFVAAETPVGFRWVYLGYIESVREYRKMTITAPKGIDGIERICALQIPRNLEVGVIEHRLQREQSGNPEPVSGVPLGGVGAGKMEFCRDGLFRNISINGSIDAPILRSEGSFFAVRAEADGKVQGRIVSTDRMHGLTSVEKLEFEGAYPTASLRSDDVDFPLAFEVRASGTIIPRNIKDSSLPLALFKVRLTARPEAAVKATAVFCVENFLGCGGGLSEGVQVRGTIAEGFYEKWEERAGNTERPWASDKLSGVLFDGSNKEDKRAEGQYVLATDNAVSDRLIGWRVDEHSDVWQRFLDSGRFGASNEAPSAGERTAGAVSVNVDLEPGETRDVRFVFAWHVPVFRQSPVMEYGHYHSNFFSSAEEIANYGLTEFDRLWTEAAEVPKLLKESTLPSWLSRTLANDAYVFSSATWLTKDGRFGVNEGPTSMFGCMGTMDQKLYGSHYYSLFFPELDRTELLGFARAQAENGGISHDLGSGHLEQKGGYFDWPDLSCAMLLLSLKHYQLTGDQEYIDEVYPRLKRIVFEYQAAMDHDGDGLADGKDVGSTFDAEYFEGLSGYTATLTLATLKALEKLAIFKGDDETASRCHEIFERAQPSAIKLLWNGHYFIEYRNTGNENANTNSHVSQLAGELFGKICDLGPLYGDQHAREAAIQTLRLNYHKDLIFPTNEATPEGKMPNRHMWGWLPHVRICLGAVPMCLGLAEEGLDALERMDRVIGELNDENRWDLRLFYEPRTGRQHWGRFYMTAPATWYAFQALLGYTWEQPTGTLGLMPNIPDSMLPFEGPLFVPGFWGWLKISKDRREISLKVIKRFDTGLKINKLRIPLRPGKLTVLVDGELAPVSSRQENLEAGSELLSCAIDLDKVGELRISW